MTDEMTDEMTDDMTSPMGGLAQAQAGSDPAVTGLLQVLSQPYMTTPEAKAQAQKILEDYQGYGYSSLEEDWLKRMKDTTQTAQEALRAARKKLQESEYDPKDKWLRMASAFAAPTRSGSFAESMGSAATQLADSRQREREFLSQRDDKILGLDTALNQMDQGILSNELKLLEAMRKSRTDMAKEALKTLGKGTGAQSKTLQALDKEFIKTYNDWVIEGKSADAAKSISELEEAVDMLGESDRISGPIIGTMPEWSRELIFPSSRDAEELILTTAQRSLKAVLGGQFARVEGEMLLKRTFNPRLEEAVNERRAYRLLNMLKQVAQNKNAAVRYFESHGGTIEGFKGKLDYTLGEFMPDLEEGEYQKVRLEDGKVIKVPLDVFERGEKAIRNYHERLNRKHSIFSFDELNKPQFKGGGIVNIADLPQSSEEFSDSDEEEPQTQGSIVPIEEINRPTLSDLMSNVAVGGVSGAVGAVGLEEIMNRLRGSSRPTPGESRILKAFELGGPDSLAETGDRVKRLRRAGVPTSMLEEGPTPVRVLGEQALIQGGSDSENVIEDIAERSSGSRQRVGAQINKALKPYPYFEHLNRLTSDLYETARPLYEEAYRNHPGISEKDVPAFDEIMNTPDGQRAVKIAIRLLRNQGKKIGREDAIGLVYKPSLEFLDYVKRGFDQLISKEEDKGPTTLGRSMRELRTRLRDQLDAVAPEYTKARLQYAGDLEVLDALKAGRDQFQRLQPEELEESLKGMTPSEHRAYRTGVAQSFYELINKPTTEINAARRVIGSPDTRKKLGMLFKGSREKRLFELALDAEMRLFDRARRMERRVESGRGRKVAKELAEESEVMGEIKEAGWNIARKTFSPVLSVARLFTRPRISLSAKQADEIANVLNQGTPSEIDMTLKRLTPILRNRSMRRLKRGKAAKAGAAVGVTLGAGSYLKDSLED